MKRTASVVKTSKSSGSSTDAAASKLAQTPVVVCIDDGGYTDLQTRRLYVVRRDKSAKAEGMLRIVDDSGEDYLYPEQFFVALPLPSPIVAKIRKIS